MKSCLKIILIHAIRQEIKIKIGDISSWLQPNAVAHEVKLIKWNALKDWWLRVRFLNRGITYGTYTLQLSDVAHGHGRHMSPAVNRPRLHHASLSAIPLSLNYGILDLTIRLQLFQTNFLPLVRYVYGVLEIKQGSCLIRRVRYAF